LGGTTIQPSGIVPPRTDGIVRAMYGAGSPYSVMAPFKPSLASADETCVPTTPFGIGGSGAMGEKLLGGAGAIAATVFVGLQFFLFVGGVSYRKDCLGSAGQVKSSWTFTWFAPIPYVFRPSEAGCHVHTGTRVALNAVGVAPFSKPTTTTMADKAVQGAHNLSDDEAYFARMKARVVEFENAPQAKTVDDGRRAFDKAIGSLGAMAPTPKYATVHGELLAALHEGRGDLDEIERAASSAGTADDQRAATRFRAAFEKINGAIVELNRLHHR
jgi:hypothetical protein